MPLHRNDEQPLFVEAAEDLARDLGIEPDAVLLRYRESLRSSPYPGLECIEPDEVEQFVRGEDLPAARLSHAESCSTCSTLLKAARPSPELRARVIEAVRDCEHVSGRDRGISWGSLKRPLLLGLPALVAGLLGGLALFKRRNGVPAGLPVRVREAAREAAEGVRKRGAPDEPVSTSSADLIPQDEQEPSEAASQTTSLVTG